MKHRLLAILFIFSFKFLAAQVPQADLAPYKQLPFVPPFKLVAAPDSSLYTKANLSKKKQTIIMVFSPDCEHCILATKDLLKHTDLFKRVQFVLATPLDYSHVSKFYREMELAAYPNIKAGYDKGFLLGTFFDVKNFPAIFVYDKNGKFKAAFGPETGSWEKIAAVL